MLSGGADHFPPLCTTDLFSSVRRGDKGTIQQRYSASNLVERLDKASTAYGMEISAEKTKLMTNNTNGINTVIKMNGQKLETVTNFKYLGSLITDESSKPEIMSRIAQTTAALTRLKQVWNDRSISLSSKIRLMRSLVTSIFLYACESWTRTGESNLRQGRASPTLYQVRYIPKLQVAVC